MDHEMMMLNRSKDMLAVIIADYCSGWRRPLVVDQWVTINEPRVVETFLKSLLVDSHGYHDTPGVPMNAMGMPTAYNTWCQPKVMIFVQHWMYTM